jgi:hypothetical protein
MSVGSERVKKWREQTKQRMISSMGGSCVICGYNKCQSALAFHHLDPNEKEFRLGSVRGNPISWSRIVEELRKCVLLCHNCHQEFHEGLVKLPTNVPKFDERFVNYREFRNDFIGRGFRH